MKVIAILILFTATFYFLVGVLQTVAVSWYLKRYQPAPVTKKQILILLLTPIFWLPMLAINTFRNYWPGIKNMKK